MTDPAPLSTFLRDVEGRSPEAAERLSLLYARHQPGSEPLPDDARDVIAVQDAFLAARRFALHQGQDPARAGWLDLGEWVKRRTHRSVQYGGVPRPDHDRLLVLARATPDGVHGQCLGCDDETTNRFAEPTLTGGRAVAHALVDDHLPGIRGRCCAWCEDVPSEAGARVLWAEPPWTRPWAEEQDDRTAAAGGDVAIDLAEMEQDVGESEAQAWAETLPSQASCRCGYSAVSGPHDDCPVCGFAGLG